MINHIRLRGKLRKAIIPVVERYSEGVTDAEIIDCLLSEFNLRQNLMSWTNTIYGMIKKLSEESKIQEFEIKSADFEEEDSCMIYLANNTPWPKWLVEAQNYDWCI